MVTAGSGEVLNVVGSTFLMLTPQKKVLGVEPSYSSVYQHATSIKSDAIKLPLTKDYRSRHRHDHRDGARSAPARSASSTSATRTTRPASS